MHRDPRSRPFSRSRGRAISAPRHQVAWWPGNKNTNGVVGGDNFTLASDVTFAPDGVGELPSFSGQEVSVVVPDAPGLDLTRLAGFPIRTWVNLASPSGDPHGGARWIPSKLGYDTGLLDYQFAFSHFESSLWALPIPFDNQANP